MNFSAGLDFSTFKRSKKALRLLIVLQCEAHRFQAMFLKAYKTLAFLMVLQVRCDQSSKMLIFRYTCDKSEGDTILTAAAGFKDSDLGRCYISLLEPLVRASLFGNLKSKEALWDLRSGYSSSGNRSRSSCSSPIIPEQ